MWRGGREGCWGGGWGALLLPCRLILLHRLSFVFVLTTEAAAAELQSVHTSKLSDSWGSRRIAKFDRLARPGGDGQRGFFFRVMGEIDRRYYGMCRIIESELELHNICLGLAHSIFLALIEIHGSSMKYILACHS